MYGYCYGGGGKILVGGGWGDSRDCVGGGGVEHRLRRCS
jgi:hypothetical protein